MYAHTRLPVWSIVPVDSTAALASKTSATNAQLPQPPKTLEASPAALVPALVSPSIALTPHPHAELQPLTLQGVTGPCYYSRMH